MLWKVKARLLSVSFAAPLLLAAFVLGACKEPAKGLALPGKPWVGSLANETFEGARARAERQGKLLLVDVWARWCAPCLAFKAEVLSDPKTLAYEDRVVLFSLDIDKPEAADYLAHYGSRSLPTLSILDPARKEVLAVLAGATSREELWSFLDDTLAADRDAPGRAELRRAHASYVTNRPEAAADYEAAAKLLTGRAHYDAVRGALEGYLESGRTQECLRLGRAELPNVAQPDALLAIAVAFVRCNDTETNRAQRLEDLALARAALATKPSSEAAPTVRAQTLELLAQLQREAGDEAGARRSDAQRLALLEQAAAATTDPDHAQAFDHMRVKLYLSLDKEPEAIALLEKRVEERPASYETHGRLGTTLLELNRPKEAIGPLEQAAKLAYGGPKLVYQQRLAQAYGATGDNLKERALLVEVVAGWDALPKSQREDSRALEARQRLADAGGPPG